MVEDILILYHLPYVLLDKESLTYHLPLLMEFKLQVVQHFLLNELTQKLYSKRKPRLADAALPSSNVDTKETSDCITASDLFPGNQDSSIPESQSPG